MKYNSYSSRKREYPLYIYSVRLNLVNYEEYCTYMYIYCACSPNVCTCFCDTCMYVTSAYTCAYTCIYKLNNKYMYSI